MVLGLLDFDEKWQIAPNSHFVNFVVDKKPQVGRGPFDQLLIWQEDTVALGLFDAQQRHLDRVPPMSLATATAT